MNKFRVGKIFLGLLTVPATTGAMLAMGGFGLANRAESFRPDNPVVSNVASCEVPVEPRSTLRSRHGDTLVASAAGFPVQPVAQTEPDDFDFDFSYAESDAAVVLFGCDCPACINALRQLRNQPPAPQMFTSRRLGPSNPGATNPSMFASAQRGAPIAALNSASQIDVADPVQGHCWVNLQERATAEDIQTVLQTLEAEETSLGQGS
jgi:hypothetical protein